MLQYIILHVKHGCKFTEKALNVHHINGNRCNNTVAIKTLNKYAMNVATSTATKTALHNNICYKLLQKFLLQK